MLVFFNLHFHFYVLMILHPFCHWGGIFWQSKRMFEPLENVAYYKEKKQNSGKRRLPFVNIKGKKDGQTRPKCSSIIMINFIWREGTLYIWSIVHCTIIFYKLMIWFCIQLLNRWQWLELQFYKHSNYYRPLRLTKNELTIFGAK